jgi:SAM-dependent methyltransferase
MVNDPEEHTRDLAATNESPTAWFEELYAQAQQGEAVVPWDRGTPQDLLVDWARNRDGAGKRALVVGCGFGRDSEFLATLKYDTTAFDVSPTAIEATKARFPATTVQYVTADLLDPPAEWRGAFDLVVESITVQSLPIRLHREASERIASFVAPGGTLLVISGARDGDEVPDGPPWPLTRDEIMAFTAFDLSAHSVVRQEASWRAEFQRDFRS